MNTVTATNAKTKFLSMVRRSHDLGEVYAITNNGQPYSVLMGHGEYEGFLETIEILKNKAVARELIQAVQDADENKTVSFESAVGRKQKK